MRQILIGIAALAASLVMLAAGTAFADTVSANFNSPGYTVGSINGQNGWMVTGAYDQGVVANGGSVPASFGNQSFRISDAVTSGSFGDQTFSMPLANQAGEATASSTAVIGTIQPHFEAQFDILPVAPGSGDIMSVSPDRGDGARMSYLRFEDMSDGIHVYFDDVTDPGHVTNGDTFNETEIATLTNTVPHTIKFSMDFLNGPDNDVVKIYIDGTLVHTGTSWEDYYLYDTESNPGLADEQSRTVDKLLFRESATANAADAGKGYLIDNLSLESGAIPTTSNTVVVTPSNMQGWAFVNDTTNGAGSGMMVTGPATPPLGTGSAQLTATTTTDGQILAEAAYAGTKLSSLTTLQYSTYQAASNASNITAIALQFNVASDATNTSDGYQGRIVYEPYTNNGGTVPLGSWHTWDALNAGNGMWWFSKPASFGGNCSISSPCTLSHIIALYPNIAINPNPALGAVVLKAGSGWTSPFMGNADALTIGVDDNNTTFDFDPNAVVPSVTTNPATSVTTSDATLNGTNGPVAAGQESFWVSTSTINTSSPTIPVGVYSTQVLPGVGANANFSDTLSSLTAPNGAVVNGQVNGTMPAITPGTTYYYVAWVDVDGTWYPGNQESVTITAPYVTTDAANPVGVTTATVNATDGPTNADNTSFWWGTTPSGTLTPGSAPTPPAGWSNDSGLGPINAGLPFSENLTGLLPNTTYNFVAWVLIGGTWYPGQVLSFTTGTAPTPTVVTNSATEEMPTTATLNGTDGAVSADQVSFWWGTTAPASPITISGSNPAATTEFPSGWTHDSGLPGVSAGQSFSEPLTGLTPGATYYYVAWVQSAGIWYPGNTLTFIAPMNAVSCAAPSVMSASPVQTISVNSDSDTPVSSSVLTSGQQYIFQVSGQWQNSNLNVADAAFSSLNNWATSYQEGYDTNPYFLGPNEFNLEVNGNFVNWGPYSTSHTYSYPFTGTGSAANFMVFDGNSNNGTSGVNTSWYGDNNGSLSVAVYQCVPPTPPTPPANACSNTSKAPAGYTLKNGVAGNPTVTLAPFTMYVGMAGNPKISGAAGDYIVCLSNGNATVTLGDGSDTIAAGNGNQSITVGSGGSGSSTITVGNGNSVINSTDSGSQSVTAGNGNNTITTGSGNDTISAGNGNNKINAAGGTDSCTVGAGKSTLTSCNP